MSQIVKDKGHYRLDLKFTDKKEVVPGGFYVDEERAQYAFEHVKRQHGDRLVDYKGRKAPVAE